MGQRTNSEGHYTGLCPKELPERLLPAKFMSAAEAEVLHAGDDDAVATVVGVVADRVRQSVHYVRSFSGLVLYHCTGVLMRNFHFRFLGPCGSTCALQSSTSS